jgi:hypothetical protein
MGLMLGALAFQVGLQLIPDCWGIVEISGIYFLNNRGTLLSISTEAIATFRWSDGGDSIDWKVSFDTGLASFSCLAIVNTFR